MPWNLSLDIPLLARVDQLDVVLLFPSDPHYKYVTDILLQEQHNTWLQIAATMDTSIPPPPPALGTTGSLGAADIQAIVEGTLKANAQQSPTKRSLTEEEQISHADDILVRYRIAFASLQPVEPDDLTKGYTVVPATISDTFKAIVSTSKTALSMRMLRDAMGVALRQASNSDSRIDAGATLELSQLDQPLLTRLKNFHFNTEPLAIHPAKAKTDISPFNLLTVRADSVAYTERIQSGARLEAQVIMEEDKTKLARKMTDLYCLGKQDCLADVLAGISNWYLFFSMTSPNFQDSALWQAMRAYYNLVSTHKARIWGENHQSRQGVFHNMLLDLANIVSSFMALGDHMEYRKAVATNQPISPKAYDAATQQAQLIIAQLNQLIAHMQSGRYTDLPTTYGFFFPNNVKSLTNRDAAIVTDTSPGTSPDKQKGTGTTPKGKQQGKDPKGQPTKDSGSPPTDLAKQKGLLVYSGGKKKLDYPKILVPVDDTPNAAKTSFCMNYILQGRACRFGKACTMLHVNTYADIPAAVQSEFVQYVKDTDSLDFAKGKGPPPGTD